MTNRYFFHLFLLVGLFFVQPVIASDQQELVERSKLTLQSIVNDDNYKNSMRSLIDKASGIVIFPSLFKAGFILGGEGGNGIVLAKRADGTWSYPAFVNIASGSVGLQIGFESSEVVLVVMTDKGLKSLMNNSFTLGADVSIAAGPVGAGVSANTTANLDADLYSFSHSKGVFGGGSLKGSVVRAKDAWNEAYYNKANVTPENILLQTGCSNKSADPVREFIKGFCDQTTKQSMQRQRVNSVKAYSPEPQDIRLSENTQEPKEILPWQRGN